MTEKSDIRIMIRDTTEGVEVKFLIPMLYAQSYETFYDMPRAVSNIIADRLSAQYIEKHGAKILEKIDRLECANETKVAIPGRMLAALWKLCTDRGLNGKNSQKPIRRRKK